MCIDSWQRRTPQGGSPRRRNKILRRLPQRWANARYNVCNAVFSSTYHTLPIPMHCRLVAIKQLKCFLRHTSLVCRNNWSGAPRCGRAGALDPGTEYDFNRWEYVAQLFLGLEMTACCVWHAKHIWRSCEYGKHLGFVVGSMAGQQICRTPPLVHVVSPTPRTANFKVPKRQRLGKSTSFWRSFPSKGWNSLALPIVCWEETFRRRSVETNFPDFFPKKWELVPLRLWKSLRSWTINFHFPSSSSFQQYIDIMGFLIDGNTTWMSRWKLGSKVARISGLWGPNIPHV